MVREAGFGLPTTTVTVTSYPLLAQNIRSDHAVRRRRGLVQQRPADVLVFPPDRVVQGVRTSIAPEVVQIEIRCRTACSADLEERGGDIVGRAVGEYLRGSDGQRGSGDPVDRTMDSVRRAAEARGTRPVRIANRIRYTSTAERTRCSYIAGGSLRVITARRSRIDRHPGRNGSRRAYC